MEYLCSTRLAGFYPRQWRTAISLYGGSCPPRGNPHRYFFNLYALDVELTLKAGASKSDLLRAMEGHILAQEQVMGTYKRA